MNWNNQAIRLMADEAMVLEASNRNSLSCGTEISVWAADEETTYTWEQRWEYRSISGTLCPGGTKLVCLGVQFDRSQVQYPTGRGFPGLVYSNVTFVYKSDKKSRFTFKPLSTFYKSKIPGVPKNHTTRDENVWMIEKLKKHANYLNSKVKYHTKKAQDVLVRSDTLEAISNLKVRGFAHLHQVVDDDVIRVAVRQIDALIDEMPEKTCESLDVLRGRM